MAGVTACLTSDAVVNTACEYRLRTLRGERTPRAKRQRHCIRQRTQPTMARTTPPPHTCVHGRRPPRSASTLTTASRPSQPPSFTSRHTTSQPTCACAAVTNAALSHAARGLSRCQPAGCRLQYSVSRCAGDRPCACQSAGAGCTRLHMTVLALRGFVCLPAYPPCVCAAPTTAWSRSCSAVATCTVGTSQATWQRRTAGARPHSPRSAGHLPIHGSAA